VPDAVFVKAAGNSACTISNTDCDAYNAVLHDANNFKDKSLIVGALAEAGGAIASYSNRAGSYSDRFVVADGRGLLKTSGAYDQGTSFAAPRVAGYLAIMRQKYPNLTAEEVASIILSTAKWNPVWGEKNAANQEIYGQGEADLDRALAAIGSLP
jgi:subtilisin family serine protease